MIYLWHILTIICVSHRVLLPSFCVRFLHWFVVC